MPSHQRPPRNWRSTPALTLTEAAAVLGISRSRAYELAQAGSLPTHEDHMGRLRVLPRDLEPLMETAQPSLFDQGAAFTDQWLAAVLAHPGIDQETAKVARWLVSEADETGALSAEAQAVLQEAQGA